MALFKRVPNTTLTSQGNGYFAVGGFDWNLQFNWHAVPEHENRRRGHSWAPAWSPTMAGGLFSIDKVSVFQCTEWGIIIIFITGLL